MSPTRRSAIAFVAIAASALVLPAAVVAIAAAALAAVVLVDALAVRGEVTVERQVASTLSRGRPTPFVAAARPATAGDTWLRQPAAPDILLDRAVGRDRVEATLTATRRGRHVLPPMAVRRVGPLGLGRWDRPAVTGPAELTVYPDLHAARRLAAAVRRGKLADAGTRMRGPLGLGTEFESIREYLPDDDIRQVNWRATVRMQRPMSNQYRVEQDRDITCVVDTGRLMAAPLGPGRTRLDAALDAVCALAMAADVVGDRIGVLAFDRNVRRHVRPRRRGTDAVVAAIYDLEPTDVESDYELAFRTAAAGKRSLVVVLTDLLEDSAAKPLIAAMPVLARRHAVMVAGSTDPDLDALLTAPPVVAADVYAAAVAVDVLDARRRVAERLRTSGADVLEAPSGQLPAACVSAYLRLKARARL